MTVRPGGAVPLTWTRDAKGVERAIYEPFTAVVEPKPDGRALWQVFEGGKENPVASGVAASPGQGKTKSAQFIARSDKV